MICYYVSKFCFGCFHNNANIGSLTNIYVFITCMQVSHSDGRVYFHSSLTHIDQILQLKTVERAFALVLHKDSTEYKGGSQINFIEHCSERIFVLKKLIFINRRIE